ncbi:spore coat protein [Bacillus sp. DJP31]|uniref:spore coat protein n=1 Tax=Bacillus sp. DJP31 TaxID=3409789 RepID=UPI003BB645E1
MTNEPQKNPAIFSKSIVDLMISDIFSRHGVNQEEKKSLSDEQKQLLKSLVEDLSSQVEQFVDETKQKKMDK